MREVHYIHMLCQAMRLFANGVESEVFIQQSAGLDHLGDSARRTFAKVPTSKPT
jgi:hypothetical protein